MNEKRDFHPLVARWLDNHHYRWRHEAAMPERGRADFVAEAADGAVLVIECKSNPDTVNYRAITQLMDYCRQLKNCVAALAIPSYLVDKTILELCETFSVRLIPVEIPETMIFASNREDDYIQQSKRIRIKETATILMAQTRTVSLRAIAKQLNITAPAIYTYYADANALIFDMALDAYNNFIHSLYQVKQEHIDSSGFVQLQQVMLHFRDWALEYSVEWLLVYGTPLPFYTPPPEFNNGLMIRTVKIFTEIIHQLSISEGYQLPPQVTISLNSFPPNFQYHLQEVGYTITDLQAFGIALKLGTSLYSMISLELNRNAMFEFISNPDDYYRAHIERLLLEYGFTGNSSTSVNV